MRARLILGKVSCEVPVLQVPQRAVLPLTSSRGRSPVPCRTLRFAAANVADRTRAVPFIGAIASTQVPSPPAAEVGDGHFPAHTAPIVLPTQPRERPCLQCCDVLCAHAYSLHSSLSMWLVRLT